MYPVVITWSGLIAGEYVEQTVRRDSMAAADQHYELLAADPDIAIEDWGFQFV